MNCVRPRSITNAIALLGICVAAGVAQATDSAYPTRPVRLVVPFSPGGGVDATARIVAPKLSESMGQHWVVDNRAGAGGNLASEIVARAKQKPGAFRHGSGGMASSNHLAAELFKKVAGIDMVHVPYKGAGP